MYAIHGARFFVVILCHPLSENGSLGLTVVKCPETEGDRIDPLFQVKA
jgi:hypothetical protein